MKRRYNILFYWFIPLTLIVVVGIGCIVVSDNKSLDMFQMSASAVSATTSAPSGAVANWFIQDVCVKNGQVIAVDPGADSGKGCKDAGATERDLEPGENLPYHKISLQGNEERDSYPVISTDGTEIYVTTDDYDTDGKPFGIFKWWDGIGIFSSDNQYAYVTDTAGSGFPTTFFGNTGNGCVLSDGWLFFPSSFINSISSSGQVALPIGDSYWQQQGIAWPGSTQCGGAAAASLHYTIWNKIPSFTYGSIGKPTTSLPTIRAVHGMPVKPDSDFLQNGHLEIFYFTPQYGYTRWESWFPNKKFANTSTCDNSYDATMHSDGIDTMVVNGVTFYRNACSDDTNIQMVNSAGGDPVSIMPIPEQNFLHNWSFSDGASSWMVEGGVSDTAEQSETCPDTTLGIHPGESCTSKGTQAGVKYLRFSCSSTSCQSGDVYQTIPISSSAQLTSGTYVIAAEARKEQGSGAITLTLSQIGTKGNVLNTKSYTTSVSSTSTHYGITYYYDPSVLKGKDTSVIWASSFVGTTIPITISPSTVALRLSISPGSTGAYDVIDAWVMKQ